ncbi:MAG: hypothetical protein PHW02_00680 [bacterium]|nr:hypothetical protein [bacterium]
MINIRKCIFSSTLLFAIVICSSDFHFSPKLNRFEINGKGFFPIGWYTTNSCFEDIFQRENDEFADPYFSNYNTFLVMLNYFDMLYYNDSLQEHKMRFLNYSPKNAYYILDLPRYSSNWSLLKMPKSFSRENLILSSDFISYSRFRKERNTANAPIFFYSSWKEPAFALLDFSSAASLHSLVVNYEKKNKFNVLSYPESFSCKFKRRDNNSVGGILFEINHKNDTSHILFASDSQSFYTILETVEFEEPFYGITMDGLWKNKKEKISFCGTKELFEMNLIDNIPPEKFNTDTFFHLISINISKILKAEIGSYEILSYEIFGLNCIFGDISVKFGNEFSLTRLKMILGSHIPKGTNILGYYTSDEFEWKEVLHGSKWNHSYMPSLYKDRDTGLREKENLHSFQKQVSEKVMQKNFFPFMLSSAQSVDSKKNNSFLMHNNENNYLRNSVFMMDNYTYGGMFLKSIFETKRICDNDSMGFIFVADGYSNAERRPVTFEMAKFKLFSALAGGANGILYYSYHVPYPSKGDAIKNDTCKMNLGFLTSFLDEYRIKDLMLSNPRRFVNEASNRATLCGKTSDNSIIFIFCRLKGVAGNLTHKKEIADFKADDPDVIYVDSLLKLEDGDMFLLDITPYSRLERRAGIVDESNAMFNGSFSLIDRKEGFFEALRSENYSKYLSSHDVKILKISDKNVFFETPPKLVKKNNQKKYSISFIYPQIIKNVSITEDFSETGVSMIINKRRNSICRVTEDFFLKKEHGEIIINFGSQFGVNCCDTIFY